jgi:hypothetical protein
MAILRPDQLTKPLNITGSLFGTSSWAISSSVALFALNAQSSPPGGPNTSIQFNDANALNGVQTFTFIKGINRAILTGSLFVTGSATVIGTFEIISANNTQQQPAFLVNTEGVVKLGEHVSTPTPITGGFMYSSSNYFLGFP